MNTREKITATAIDLFSEKGYAAVRTKEISKEAGVNETTLFRNFHSKRDLFEYIITHNIKAIDNEKIFHKKFIGDLDDDLMMLICKLFMLYRANARIIKMIMKSIIENGDRLSEYDQVCRGGHIKKYLIEYFEMMKSKKNQGKPSFTR